MGHKTVSTLLQARHKSVAKGKENKKNFILFYFACYVLQVQNPFRTIFLSCRVARAMHFALGGFSISLLNATNGGHVKGKITILKDLVNADQNWTMEKTKQKSSCSDKCSDEKILLIDLGRQ